MLYLREKSLCLLLIIGFFACNQTAKEKAPAANTTSETKSTDPSEKSSPETEKADLAPDLDVDTPEIEDEPITSNKRKNDPECDEKNAAGKTALDPEEQKEILDAYLTIQKDYLGREKGASGFALKRDKENPLSYELTFQDLLGKPGKMKYKFGKAIIDKDDRVTLCLDEGNKLLWAGTYRRDKEKGFIPDL